jgi:hypothetical protein
MDDAASLLKFAPVFSGLATSAMKGPELVANRERHGS